MSATRLSLPIAAIAVILAIPSFALANSTGNESNNPAVIQRPIMPVPEAAPVRQRSATLRERTMHYGNCSFAGVEAGSRNPDNVQCKQQ